MRICIVGGGPSGIMAALCSKKYNEQVTLFEKKERIGKKLLVTGNGRCNFTNAHMDASFYYSDDASFVDACLQRFSNTKLIEFFQSSGMLSKTKNGYYYPVSDQASTVLDLLRIQLSKSNVFINTEEEIVSIHKKNDIFVVKSSKNEYEFDRVILACGGCAGLNPKEQYNGLHFLKDLNIDAKETTPALTSLFCEGLNFPELKGVRADVKATLCVNNENIKSDVGELLFTDYGLSGIVIFQLSRIAGYALKDKKNVSIHLDLFPNFPMEDYVSYMRKRFEDGFFSNETYEEWFIGLLNKKLNTELIKKLGVRPSDVMKKEDRESFIQKLLLLKNLEIKVNRTGDYASSQVMAGGALTYELSDSLECKKVPGLYIVGELLNVDGICGGYNLQWAFTTGYIAGEATKC